MKQGIKRFVSMFAMLGASTLALASGDDDGIQHIGEEVAGIDLTVGPGAGLISCGADQVYLEAAPMQNGISRIRVYFFSLGASVDRTVLSRRVTCAIRLKEKRSEGTRLVLEGAYLRGDAEISSGVTANVGVSIASSGQVLATANSPIQFSGYVSKRLLAAPTATDCTQRDRIGHFGISLAATLHSSRGQYGFFGIERLDLYVKEEVCQ